MDERRVLMVCYDFPPVTSPGAQRAEKLAKYLPRFGWVPTILCARLIPPKRYGASTRADRPRGVAVHEVPSFEVKQSSWYRLRSRKDPNLATRSPLNAMNLLAGGALWVPPAVRVGKRLLHAHRYDAVFATGHPMRGLVVGRRLKDHSGLPLVLELRDPWIPAGQKRRGESPRLTHERRVEASTLNTADHVTAVTTPIGDLLEDRYPLLKGRVSLSPNGFDPDDFASLDAAPKRAPGDKFLIANHGSVYGVENIRTLFRAISKLAASDPGFATSVRMEIVGGMTQNNIDALCAGLSPRPPVYAAPRVDHLESIRVMRAADALILTRADTWGYSTKIFDYLASGTPIILIAPNGSIAGDLIDEAGAGATAAPGDDGEVMRILTKLYVDWRDRATRASPRAEVLKRFEWGTIAGNLATILDAIAIPSAAPS